MWHTSLNTYHQHCNRSKVWLPCNEFRLKNKLIEEDEDDVEVSHHHLITELVIEGVGEKSSDRG